MNSTAYPRHQRLRGLLVASPMYGLLSSCGLLRDVSHPDDETTRTETRQESGVNPPPRSLPVRSRLWADAQG